MTPLGRIRPRLIHAHPNSIRNGKDTGLRNLARSQERGSAIVLHQAVPTLADSDFDNATDPPGIHARGTALSLQNAVFSPQVTARNLPNKSTFTPHDFGQIAAILGKVPGISLWINVGPNNNWDWFDNDLEYKLWYAQIRNDNDALDFVLSTRWSNAKRALYQRPVLEIETNSKPSGGQFVHPLLDITHPVVFVDTLASILAFGLRRWRSRGCTPTAA